MSVNFAYLNTFGKNKKSPYNICRISYDVCTHFGIFDLQIFLNVFNRLA